jgi:hypothetical protein
MSEISHVEIDGNRASVQNIQNDVKVILLDGDDGNCLNEGNWWTFLPTEAEVKEFVATNNIKGKIE